jgi:hypothetical protein
MKILTITLATAATLALMGADSNTANAAYGYGGYGIHLGGRNVHLDIGQPHGYRSYYQHRVGNVGHHYDWHNTSHYDYHPGGYQRHYNHYDYVPGHYDYHRTGHWDRHRNYRH